MSGFEDDDFPNVAARGIQAYGPDAPRTFTRPLLDWLEATGCSRVAVHVDVDTAYSDEIGLGLGFVPWGLARGEVRRVMRLRQIVSGFPLLRGE
ncbi:hypothetical protein [Streptomyces sp. NPDC019937]|uniref:hypothetical protein n=1 Tax=Streptomyces sp. NPDC019937 TaxID=3154787 RepID=UPI0033E3706C